MRLRTHLFVAIASVAAVTVALVTWSVTASARRAFEVVDEERTAALMAQFRREFARERDEVGRRIDRIATSDEFRRAAPELASGDRAPHVQAAAPLAAAQDLDYLDLVADDGHVISSAHWPARFGYRHAWAIAAARQEAFLQLVEGPSGASLGIVAVRTVTTTAGRIYLAGGRALDREFLRSLALAPGMRAFLYRNVAPERSRDQLVDASGTIAHPGQLEPLIARVRDSGSDRTEVVEWPEGRERVEGIPLRGPAGVVLGVLLVGSSARQLDALIDRVRWSGVGFAVVGVLVAGALSYALATRVTRPVEQLAAGARSIAAGDWSAPIDVHASGEIAALADGFRDMTRQLIEQRERLVQAERVAAWRELARRLAHELKNPLFPLRLTVDNLQRAKTDHPQDFDEVFEESMGTLRTGLASLNAVIGRFSDFSRKPTPIFEERSPNEVVQNVLPLVAAQGNSGGERQWVAVSLDLDPDVGTIPLDAEQLGRAIHNLMLNAFDAMPAGGSMTIRTKRSPSVVTIEVTDTGAGLLDEERERLFTPYYTTKQHGTGLGLAIVQSIVSDHGGRVRVESSRGHGTTFFLELPVQRPGAALS
jgi:signal transduction histidine kinase